MDQAQTQKLLVLGASGYVGGRLVPLLLEKGFQVRAAARNTDKLSCRDYASHPGFEPFRVDVMDQDSLDKACQGCRAAFYLVHSMGPDKDKKSDFESKDRQAARNMVTASEKAGLKQIIYLGGLGEDDEDLSHHLKSRLEVGRILQESSVPLTFLKAAMILGSGSASFEIMRYLVERLPVMITPTWVHTDCQPIAITNVLGYLAGSLDNPDAMGKSFDIGGPDILSYAKLFQIYAREAGLAPRLIVPVPVLSPTLSSYWIHLVTPVPASIAAPLAQGLKNTVVCRENTIREVIPQELVSCREAIKRALEHSGRDRDSTCWRDAGEVSVPEWTTCSDSRYAGGSIYEIAYQVHLGAPPEKVWPVIEGIGGENGWYYANSLWRLRGLADKIMGGSGYRKGRRSREELRFGDTVDFWKVIQVQKNEHLKLLAEMKMPGEATLEFELQPEGTSRSILVQRTRFYPRGLPGIAYWKSLVPFHNQLFKGMLRGISRKTGARIIKGPIRAGKKDSCRIQ